LQTHVYILLFAPVSMQCLGLIIF